MMRDLITECLGIPVGKDISNEELLKRYRHAICADIVERLKRNKSCSHFLYAAGINRAIAIVEAVEKGE